jgi:transcriptional regulator with XRE-family HTH domain
MGQEVRGSPEAAALSDAEPADASIGSFLARQRRLRGISVDELAQRTRIPRRSLERLEAGAFDATPDGFVRGFVRTVAEALGLDPDDAVNRLLREPREDEALLLARARERRRKLALWIGLGTVALLLMLSLARLGVWLFAGEGDEPPVVYRRDALRELESQPPAEPESGPPES